MSAPVRWRSTTFAYPGGPTVLDGVDLAVDEGDVVLVAGDSGSGKSTLLRSTNGLVPHTSGGRFSGDVMVGERSTRDNRPRDLADVVGFVHQDPEAQFVVDRVEHDLAFSLENLGVDGSTMRRRIEEVLDALGIAHLRHRSPGTLSGGEKQRCAIAGALAAGPAVLVLDEPTSMLDPQGADDVLAAVARLNDDLGTTVVMSEHRFERAAPLCTWSVLLDAGRVARCGPPADVLVDHPGAPPVTHLGRLLGWVPPPLTVRDARAHARRDPTLAGALGEARPGPGQGSGSGAGRGPETAGGSVLVRARGLAVAPGRQVVLSSVDLDVHEGEVVALLGRNGSGKTTLLRALAGLLDPRAGIVQRDAPVAYVPQDPGALLFAPTVRDEVMQTRRLLRRASPTAPGALPRRARRGRASRTVEPGAARADDAALVAAWLDRLGLQALAARHPRTLSTGERQRVAIAAVAVGGAPVLLLDEPTRGIDAASAAALERCILEHAGGAGAVVLATHDVELAARCATRVVVLGDGEVVADGPARTVLAGSLFAPQVLRVLPPFLTVAEVTSALATGAAAPARVAGTPGATAPARVAGPPGATAPARLDGTEPS
ncbi:MAG: ATP-binding cassette domain-containing protein [Actinobacteria bacterium]|nr:ATP-binding cassette domain-containing protein [Actinomycetota bacterium]